MARNFIKGAIKHPGSLRSFAKKHHALDENGDINLAKARRAAQREREPARAHRLRQINLAATLRRLRA
jgi:hypothetical protein